MSVVSEISRICGLTPNSILPCSYSPPFFFPRVLLSEPSVQELFYRFIYWERAPQLCTLTGCGFLQWSTLLVAKRSFLDKEQGLPCCPGEGLKGSIFQKAPSLQHTGLDPKPQIHYNSSSTLLIAFSDNLMPYGL